MRLKRNFGTKIAALVASLTALGGVWALVHQNPPPTSAGATTTAAAPTSVAGPATSARKSAVPVQQATNRKHTRTHVS